MSMSMRLKYGATRVNRICATLPRACGPICHLAKRSHAELCTAQTCVDRATGPCSIFTKLPLATSIWPRIWEPQHRIVHGAPGLGGGGPVAHQIRAVDFFAHQRQLFHARVVRVGA